MRCGRRVWWWLAGIVGVCLWQGSLSAAEPESRVDFNRQVLPLLSRKCVVCHGPDEAQRKGGLRLDQQEGVRAELDSGSVAVVPGKLEESELWLRISSDDPNARMPPGPEPLSAAEQDILKRWIEQGAKWDQHWSYAPLKRSVIPAVTRKEWVLQPIDRFILSRLEKESLAPSEPADRVTLLRRVTHDLTGLPPTASEVTTFLADQSPDAYEKVVDRLLASPHFGERMAVWWLDLVRYADTVGYHGDQEREISPYRDYVIQAFNSNLPFDQFTIEQLAGDLLPEPTPSQLVATGFNMLGMTTIEGGAQAREYLAKYDADRVRTVSGAWLGVTLGCAECHDHKFDPLLTRDFYSLAAFFADIKQEGVENPAPNLYLPTPEQAAQEVEIRQELEVARAAAKDQDGKDKAKDSPEVKHLKEVEQQLSKHRAAMRKTITTIRRDKPREVRVLPRGDWLSSDGAVVEPAVPVALGKLTVFGRATRLDLARWLVSAENPLTARITMNRLWKLAFGRGLTGTLDDIGLQGERSEYPELLDWLAVEFRETGWDVKRMLRMLVTSQAYRQSSNESSSLRELDPRNRLFARQGRYRIEAEFIRDRALAVSGLLVREIGGDSVKPYQPDGYYQFLNFPTRTYVSDTGTKQYRRGLYTHWQRTYLHPWLIAFDAPSREECTADRPRSSTPQQALVLLNDPSFVEADREFARRILESGGTTPKERVQWAYLELLSRAPTAEELRVVTDLYSQTHAELSQTPEAATKLLSVGLTKRPDGIDPVEWASWSEVARALMNLHETILRE